MALQPDAPQRARNAQRTELSGEAGYRDMHHLMRIEEKWSDKLKKLDFQEMVMFLQHLPTRNWAHHELEMEGKEGSISEGAKSEIGLPRSIKHVCFASMKASRLHSELAVPVTPIANDVKPKTDFSQPSQSHLRREH
ncbi:hypothetical protein E2562_026483 [Oryza meyeriana var. granulata]|uniref:Uncharacterized protein n=1 Tax=Oryza meyeriana var. granulata TaxID=110450 RepID=A0A6G1DN65_9ORYZ|nr:hypothetical protein E2562_026483 [Oryza meyeriana var. granulata]